MGRAKLRMELITNERKRMTTFKKRKEGLVKMIKELTTLCGVRACMIIYGPRQETWPENKDEIREIIDFYEAKNGGKTIGLSDFFHDRRRKIEEELSSIRKKKWEAKVSAWTRSSNGLTPEELRILGENITLKYEIVKSRIELVKRSCKEGLAMSNTIDSTWFHGPAMASPPYTVLPQLPAVSAAAPLPWHEILDGVNGQGNLTEDCALVGQPPNYQLPTVAPLPWHEILDGVNGQGNLTEDCDIVCQPPNYQLPAVAPLPWHEILDGVNGQGNLTEDCAIVGQQPNYQLPAVHAAAPFQRNLTEDCAIVGQPPNYQIPAVPAAAPLTWREILDCVNGQGNLTEDCAIMGQPPNYTILPQVPATEQLPFFWQEDVDDVLFGVTGTTNWGLMCYE